MQAKNEIKMFIKFISVLIFMNIYIYICTYMDISHILYMDFFSIGVYKLYSDHL